MILLWRMRCRETAHPRFFNRILFLEQQRHELAQVDAPVLPDMAFACLIVGILIAFGIQ
jgi:hypothetical protein